MGIDVSVVISAKDHFSGAITTIRNSNKAFRKDLTETADQIAQNNKRISALKQAYKGMQVELDEAAIALGRYKEEHRALNTDMSRLNLAYAHDQYNSLREAIQDATEQLRDARKENRSLQDDLNRDGSRVRDTSTAAGQAPGLLKKLGKLGAKSLGELAGNVAASYVGSAFGEMGSTYLSSMLSGGASGAAIGSMIMPGFGTVAGAAIGSGIGLLNGKAQVFQKEDKAFQSVIQEQYNSTKEALGNTLSTGSGIAAGRETSLQSFTALLGDEEQAEQFTRQIQDFANVTPFFYDDLAAMGKRLQAYGYHVEELLPTLRAIGNAGAALGMDQSGMTAVATALGRLRAGGKTTTESINLMLEQGIPVYDYLAKSLAKSKEQAMEMVAKGLLPGEESARAIAAYMGEGFADGMEAQSKTFAGLESTLQGMRDEMANAMGQGYNDTRKTGMANEIAHLQGETGTGIQQANYQIGQWKASLENLKGQIQMDMQDAVMSGISVEAYGPEIQTKLAAMHEAYAALASSGKADAGAQMGALLAEAQVMAENEYMASEGAQLEMDMQLGLIRSIRSDTALKAEYYGAGYAMQQEFAKGIKAAQPFVTAAMMPGNVLKVNNAADERYNEFLKGQSGYGVNENGMKPDVTDRRAYSGSFAYGLDRVPYDNFPALLHEGEQVLTAAQARKAEGVTVNIHMNDTVIREEADVQKIGWEIVGQIIRAHQVS